MSSITGSQVFSLKKGYRQKEVRRKIVQHVSECLNNENKNVVKTGKADIVTLALAYCLFWFWWKSLFFLYHHRLKYTGYNSLWSDIFLRFYWTWCHTIILQFVEIKMVESLEWKWPHYRNKYKVEQDSQCSRILLTNILEIADVLELDPCLYT